MRSPHEVKRVRALYLSLSEGALPGLARSDLRAVRVVLDALLWMASEEYPAALQAFVQDVSERLRAVGVEVDVAAEAAADDQDAVRRLPHWLASMVHQQVLQIGEAMVASRVDALVDLAVIEDPAPPSCRYCGCSHPPQFPHNPFAHYYRVSHRAARGLDPTWETAASHCSEAVQEAVMRVLVRAGQWPYAERRDLDLLVDIREAVLRTGSNF